MFKLAPGLLDSRTHVGHDQHVDGKVSTQANTPSTRNYESMHPKPSYASQNSAHRLSQTLIWLSSGTKSWPMLA